ncbi:ABC transporter substrate-binding protein, partial [Zoogloea sp.]
MSASPPRRRFLTAGLGSTLLLLGSGGGCRARHREPIRFATNPWPGFDPLYIARDKGYFDDAGLNVALVDLT